MVIRSEGPRGGPGTSIAQEGDRCSSKGLACSVDGKESLTCGDAGVMEVANYCHGADACKITDAKVHCDSSVAKEGDPCENGAACSDDGTGFLSCDADAHRMVQTTTCHARGGKPGCRVEPDQVTCDHDFGRPGDVCGKGTVCSEDGKSRLECKDGHFAKERDCRACEAKGGRVFCR